jgi:hypothetical protein
MRRGFAICDLRFAIGGIAALILTGCITHSQHPSAAQPSTAIDPATTQPSYWLEQPATATVTGIDFDRMVDACEDVAGDYLFKIDRVDYRSGVVITAPTVSSQWYEPWRRDNQTLRDVEESSVATIRRTIRFEFTRLPDGVSYEVSPKVLVERQSVAEKRITSVVLYRGVFTAGRGRERATGTRESDVGIILPARYWYPIRRDAAFERLLAREVEKKLKHQ